MTGSRTRILAFVDYYLPGYKFGGPTQVLANLVECLGDEFEFKIVTTDRDFGDTQPYPGALIDSWQEVGKAKVCYLPQSALTLKELRNLIATTDHDIIYLNSLFSPRFTLKPLILRRLGLIHDVPVIVAPRGELSAGASWAASPSSSSVGATTTGRRRVVKHAKKTGQAPTTPCGFVILSLTSRAQTGAWHFPRRAAIHQ